MKKLLYLILSSIILLLIFSGCQDRTELTAPSPANGKVDFTRLVSIGNSLTAGYQSDALYEDAQMYAFGAQMAKQVNANYAIPTISDPGIGGRMYIKSVNLDKGEIVIGTDSSSGVPTNLGYKGAYNNLGVPDALVYDVLNATNSENCALGLNGHPVVFFNLILRNLGTQFQQAKSLNPTFLTLWIGNNDVLLYAITGGTSPSEPTNSGTFNALFSQLGDSVASLNCKVAIANIPDVTSIPFFTTVGPVMAMQIPWALFKPLGVPGLIYQKHGEKALGTGIADSTALLTGQVLITLPGSDYATLVSQSTGKFYRDNHYPALPPGIDTTKPFGLSPQNPWPDALILDPDEINTAKTTTADFNTTIAAVVNKYSDRFVLVNINKFFNTVRAADFAGGTVINGVRFFTSYLTGGLFSLDGIHPTSQGQAVVANQFLAAINAKFGSNFSMIDVAAVPGSLILAKRAYEQSHKLPYFEPGTFNHIFY